MRFLCISPLFDAGRRPRRTAEPEARDVDAPRPDTSRTPRRAGEGKGGHRPGPEPRAAAKAASMARTHPLRCLSTLAGIMIALSPFFAAPTRAAEWHLFKPIKTDLQPANTAVEAIWRDQISTATEDAKKRGHIFYHGKKISLSEGQQAPATFAESTFSVAGKTYIVSSMLTRRCDNGANSSSAGLEPSRCEMRLTTGEAPDAQTVKLADNACIVWPDLADDPSKQFTRVRFDGKTMEMETYIGGKPVTACFLTIKF